MYRFLFLFFITTSLIHPLFGQDHLNPSLSRQLDSLVLRDVPLGAPGVATAIIKNGQVIYTKVGGYANLQDHVLITENSLFNLASNGKQFTALAVLLLEHEGKLSLEQDIREFFPDLYPEIPQKIMLSHLLTHTSGIRDVYDLWSLKNVVWWKNEFGNADVLQLLREQQQLNFEPGSDYLYSNSNYLLLAAVVQKASGKTFVEYTRQLFDRLGMEHTFFVDDYKSIPQSRVAQPYFNFDSWFKMRWNWNACGDGNLFSSLKDQIRWEGLLQQEEVEGFPREVIVKSQVLVDTLLTDRYGFGLEFSDFKGYSSIYHKGATGAWKAMVRRLPEQGLAAITVINTGKADPCIQTDEMLEKLLGVDSKHAGAGSFPLPAEKKIEVAAILGVYLIEGGNYSYQLVEKEGDLYLRRMGRSDVRLERESPNIFCQWNDTDFKLAFIQEENGVALNAYYPGLPVYHFRKEAYDWQGFAYEQFDGKYRNQETSVTVSLKYVEGQQYEVKVGKNQLEGLLIGPTKMLVDSYVVDLIEPAALHLAGDRIRRVLFERE